MVNNKKDKFSVLMVSPETARLPPSMGPLAKYISGKSGGMGEVVSALCEGLAERGIPVHITLPSIKQKFMRESGKDLEEWRDIVYKTAPENIHLVRSKYFSSYPSIYDGDTSRSAADFQSQVVNNVIKDVSGKAGGRLIIHSHDWMAGGIITAFANKRGIPVLHTLHNTHTRDIPLNMLDDVDIEEFKDRLYFTNDGSAIDSQATAIKNATLINYVGPTFLHEVVDGYFPSSVVPESVRQETRSKFYSEAAKAILNAPSMTLYPEVCEHLARTYGPYDDVIEAKKENLVVFQERTGLKENPDAVLFLWPSRLDPAQKGVELLEKVAYRFVMECEESGIPAQIAVIGDSVSGDRTHSDILGKIACASEGRIAYFPYNEHLCMLGYGAANDSFGASLYEPCGQIDQVANRFGATATNRDTGGYHDKIRHMSNDYTRGNGFLFRDYDEGGLMYGLRESFKFHTLPKEFRMPQLQRIMKEARVVYNPEVTSHIYAELYERLSRNIS